MKLHLPLSLYHAVLLTLAAAPTFIYAEQAAPTPDSYTDQIVSTVEEVTPYSKNDQQAFLLKQDLVFNGAPIFGGSQFFTSFDKENLVSLTFREYTASARNAWSDLSLQGLANVSFSEHSSDVEGAMGGAIYNNAGKVSIDGNKSVSFTGNSVASGNGCAIYNQDGTFTINGNDSVSFSEHSSDVKRAEGGAIYNKDGTFTIDGNKSVSFTGNSVVSDKNGTSYTNGGGAIYNEGNFSISGNKDVTFSGNSANSGGGAIYNEGYFSISGNKNVTFSGNSANSNGGAIYSGAGSFSIIGNDSVEFSGNQTYDRYYSFALYCYDGQLEIVNNGTVIFKDNRTESLDKDILPVSLKSTQGKKGKISLSARPGGSIEFYDRVDISVNETTEVNYNKTYVDKDEVEHAQTGDIVFAGETRHWVNTQTHLWDGRLIVRDKAVYGGGGLQLHQSESANSTPTTLLLHNGVVERTEIIVEAGTELAVIGKGVIDYSGSSFGKLIIEDGGSMSLTIDESHADKAALILEGGTGYNTHPYFELGKATIRLDKVEGMRAKGRYRLMTLTGNYRDTPASWTSDNITIEGQNGWAVGFDNLVWDDDELWRDGSDGRIVWYNNKIYNDGYLFKANTLYLDCTYTWTNGAGNGAWDTSSANWLNAGADKSYRDGFQVLFGNDGSGTVTLDSDVAPSETVVNNDKGHDYVFDGKGSLAGDMNLVKSGEGKLTINTENTYTGGTEIKGGTVVTGTDHALGSGKVDLRNGTLDLGGHRADNDVQIMTGAVLVNSRNFTGDLTLEGSGTAHVDSYTLGKDQVLGASAEGMEYKGSLTLAGGKILLKGAPMVVQGPVTFAPGTTTTVDVSLCPKEVPLKDGSLLATFADNTGYAQDSLTLTGLKNASLIFNGDTGALTLMLIAPVDTSYLTGNQRNTYVALEQIANGGTLSGELGSLAERVLRTDSPEAVAALLDRIGGASLATAMNSQIAGNMAHLRRLRQSIGSGQSLALHAPTGRTSAASAQDGKAPLCSFDPYMSKRMAAYVNAYNSDHTLSADASGSGMRRTEWGGVLGLEGQVSKSLTLGAALSAGHAKIEPTGDSRYHEEAAHFDLYAVAGSDKGWQSITSVGVGFHSFDFRRHYLDGRMAKANGVDGISFNAMEEVNYAFAVGEQSRLQPFFAVQTSVNRIDSFSESGAGNASLQGESRDAWATDLTLGARYLHSFSGICREGATFGLQTGVTASVGDMTADLPLRFQGAPGTSFIARSARGNRWGYNVEAALSLPVSTNTSVFAAGGTILRGDSSEANAQIGVKISF